MSSLSIVTEKDDRDRLVSFRMGTEVEKREILEKYPRTRAVISDNGYFVVSVIGDEIVGFLWAFKREIAAPIEREELFINVVEVIDPDLRCKGIASGMVNIVKSIAKAENAYQIRAYCDIRNVASHRLWVKNGFSINPCIMPNGTIPGSFVSYLCQ